MEPSTAVKEEQKFTYQLVRVSRHGGYIASLAILRRGTFPAVRPPIATLTAVCLTSISVDEVSGDEVSVSSSSSARPPFPSMAQLPLLATAFGDGGSNWLRFLHRRRPSAMVVVTASGSSTGDSPMMAVVTTSASSRNCSKIS
ncbi:hypothetical protein L1887_28670 [Cichorium endivia]|nr:hypothetical protein L1887_28670 [Cichorium endivia]